MHFYHKPSLEELNSAQISSFDLVLQSHGEKSLEEALSGNYVYVDWGRDLENIHTTRLPFKSRPLMYTNQHIIAQRYVEKNNASAFLPLVEGYTHESTSVVKGSPRLSRQVYAVWHKGNTNSEAINGVVEALLLIH